MNILKENVFFFFFDGINFFRRKSTLPSFTFHFSYQLFYVYIKVRKIWFLDRRIFKIEKNCLKQMLFWYSYNFFYKCWDIKYEEKSLIFQSLDDIWLVQLYETRSIAVPDLFSFIIRWCLAIFFPILKWWSRKTDYNFAFKKEHQQWTVFSTN